MTGGKRGSSHKLKTILESEASPAKRKEPPAAVPKAKPNNKKGKISHETRPDQIKMNEMLAFANVPNGETNASQTPEVVLTQEIAETPVKKKQDVQEKDTSKEFNEQDSPGPDTTKGPDAKCQCSQCSQW